MRYPAAIQPHSEKPELEVPPEVLEPLIRRQDQGLDFYGDQLLPPSKRFKACPPELPLLQACLLHGMALDFKNSADEEAQLESQTGVIKASWQEIQCDRMQRIAVTDNAPDHVPAVQLQGQHHVTAR